MRDKIGLGPTIKLGDIKKYIELIKYKKICDIKSRKEYQGDLQTKSGSGHDPLVKPDPSPKTI